MNQKAFFEFAEKTCQEALALARKKNNDYGNGGADPFFNLRRGGLHGLAVRMDDKVSRLLSLSDKGAEAKVDESLKDTLLDLLNYSWIALAWMEEQASEPAKPTIQRMELSRFEAGTKHQIKFTPQEEAAYKQEYQSKQITSHAERAAQRLTEERERARRDG